MSVFQQVLNNEIPYEATHLKGDLNRELKIYPNPIEGLITLEFDIGQGSQIKNISIASLQGSVLLEKTQEIQRKEIIDLSTFDKEIYIVNILLKDGSKITRQIIKE